MKQYFGIIFLMCFFAFLGNGCRDDETVANSFLEVAIDTVNFTTAEGSRVVSVSSNVDWRAVVGEDWVDVSANGQELTIHVTENVGATLRESQVVVSAGELTAMVLVRQLGTESDEIAGDIQIQSTRAEASAQPLDDVFSIDCTIDGSRNATQAGGAYWASMSNQPVELTYYFENVSSLDYVIYYPAPYPYNGQWGKVEIWAQCEGDADFRQVMTMDCGYSTNTISMFFPEALENPEAIKFVVNSGDGGYVSCAEVEFYQYGASNFDPLTLFTDETCSELKDGITQTDIDNCVNGFYRDIASQLLDGTYPSEFRIQTYRAYPNSAEEASENKIQFAYSRLDNPTGISVSEGEEVVVFVGPMGGQAISIGVQNLDVSSGDGYGVTTYGLREGVNKITMDKEGLLYVMYNTSDYETAPEVKIHIASGEVNGYFDISKHTAADWDRLFSVLGPNKMFDVVGHYAHMTFPRNLLVLSNGADLIEIYDEMVEQEQVFMGLRKYDRMFGNRMYFHVMYGSYMYATTYHTAYNSSTLSSILNADNFKTGGYWGPAHEVGHCNQTRGLVWIGMTEVTNNILALHVQTYWGNESRLMNPDSGYASRYEKAMTNYFTTKQAHVLDPDVFCRLVPFWQLELYMNKVLENSDFYKDVFEHLRTNPTLSTAGEQQTEFVANCSEQAGLNLFDFFERWGFLTPIDSVIGDYGSARMRVTEARVEEIRSRVADYPKPAAAFEYITDENYELFRKPFETVSVGSVSVVGGTEVSIEGCSNAVAYEVYDEADSLLFVSPAATDEQDVTFTLTTSWAEGFKVYAIAADGSRTEITAVREE